MGRLVTADNHSKTMLNNLLKKLASSKNRVRQNFSLPQTVSISLVINEADIIEYFVRANLEYVDLMLIAVNPSADGTTEIIKKLIAEGLPIILWERPINYYDQISILSNLAWRIRDILNEATLVFLDADEIIRADSRAAFEQDVAAIPTGHIGLIPWKTFIPGESSSETKFRPQDWRECLKEEIAQYYKIVIPAATKLETDHRIAHGAHHVVDKNDNLLPCFNCAHAYLAHLPARSQKQLRHKIFGGLLCRSLLNTNFWKTDYAYQWMGLAKKFEKGERYSIKNLAKSYLAKADDAHFLPTVHCPLPMIKLRYQHLRSDQQADFLLYQRIKHSLISQDGVWSALNFASLTSNNPKIDQQEAIFSPELHSAWLKFDWPPFSQLQSLINPANVIDIGCGLGAYLKVFHSIGAKVHGIDGSAWSALHYISQESYSSCDLAKDIPSITEDTDLSICTEVLGHLPRESGNRIVSLLCSVTRRAILFSAEQPNQPGIGHITLLEPQLWLEQFAANGWIVDFYTTLSVRMLSSLHWFKRNLFVLRPTKEMTAPTKEQLSMLFKITKQQLPWPDQSGKTIASYPGEINTYSLINNDLIPPLPLVHNPT
ncbi:MAG: glycosyltransferase family 2 protein [Deltaproteobacteria bacterium]|nr:glycosyltransferase family 2 protein [Deltaproteobacteria bacterium]